MNVKQEVGLTKSELDRLKVKLEKRRDELRPNLKATREALTIGLTADPLDITSSEYERDMATKKLDREDKARQEVAAALARMERSDYGACEQCEEPIPVKRLNAVPWATHCAPCQSKIEAAQRLEYWVPVPATA